jgi:hypothetical protein
MMSHATTDSSTRLLLPNQTYELHQGVVEHAPTSGEVRIQPEYGQSGREEEYMII